MSANREPVQVASFRLGEDFFQHQIFPQKRDQVELIDSKGETLLEFFNDLILCDVKGEPPEFSNGLIVRDAKGVVGRIVMEGLDRQWVFYERPLQTRVMCSKGMSLIAFEVEISKRYLLAQQAALVDSEGGHCD